MERWFVLCSDGIASDIIDSSLSSCCPLITTDLHRLRRTRDATAAVGQESFVCSMALGTFSAFIARGWRARLDAFPAISSVQPGRAPRRLIGSLRLVRLLAKTYSCLVATCRDSYRRCLHRELGTPCGKRDKLSRRNCNHNYIV